MSYLVIFIYFFGLLAQRSHAVPWEEKLDPNLIPNTYEKGGRSFMPPRVERGVSTCQFQRNFLNITRQYGIMIMNELFSQADEKGRELILDIKNATEHLQSVMRSGGKGPDRKEMESAMAVFIKQLETFMELKPGYTSVKHSELLPVPAPPPVPPPQIKKRSAKELFLKFPKVVYEGFVSTTASITNMYHEGWRAVTPFFYVVQAQLRDHILNREVTNAYKQYVSVIYGQSIRWSI